jgi:ALMS motif
MSQKEMKDLNSKLYNNIPDVKKKRNEEKKKEELVDRLESSKSYGKVI